MIKGIKVNITLRDHSTGNYLVIPVVPPSIPYQDGNPQNNTTQILNLGNVEFANGIDLDSITWNSFFPARYDPGYCATSSLREPLQYRDLISGWKDNSTQLQLIIPAAGINKAMKVDGFNWELRGFEGDIYYQLTLKEYRKIRPKKLKVDQGSVNRKKGPEARPAPPEQPTPRTYTVQPGDYLIKIGKKLGVDWRTIYNKNKDVIGPNPDLIYAGQVYKI